MDRFINTNTINQVFATIRQDIGSFVGTKKHLKTRSLHLCSSLSNCADQMRWVMDAVVRAAYVAATGRAPMCAAPAWRLPNSRTVRRMSPPMDLS